MIVFLLLLLLVGGLVYYWQKEPILVEKFVSSTSTDFKTITPTVDILGKPMNGTLYMFYALTTFIKPGVIAGSDGIPAGGGDAGFNYLTNIGLRIATEDERAFFLRSGGKNREKTTYKFSSEVGGNGEMPNIYNQARLVVSTKPPNTRWDATSDPRVSFKITNTVLAVETVLQGQDWIRGIIRYPFTDSGIFDVFTIDPAEYTKAISDCLFIGRQVVKDLSTKGIIKIELDPTAQSINEIADNRYITYYDINSNAKNGSSSSAAVAPSTDTISYTGELSGQTPENVRNKLVDLSGVLQKSTNFKNTNGTSLSLREALQQKCGATMFNKLTFEATVDAVTCKKTIDLLIKYYIPFNYKKLYECTLCSDSNDNCKPGNKPSGQLGTVTSLAKFENPIRRTGFANAPADASGVRLRINDLKLGNGFTYELQLNDVSDTIDNSSKYIFNPLRFTAGKRNDESADINILEIVINEYANVIQVYEKKGTRNILIGEIATPANFKLYSTIKLQGIIYTFGNKSYESDIEDYSVSAIEQDIIDSKRYGIFDTDIYSRAATVSNINFIYNDANTIQITFTVGTQSRIVPSGNYTLVFNNSELGSFIDNNNLSIGQFNRILLNVLSGELLFMNNSTKVTSINTKFKEQANALFFTIALKDPTNTQTYYTGTYTALGNRYPNTITTLNLTQGSSSSAAAAPPAATTDDKEVVFIETPVKDGIDAATTKQLVTNLGLSIATIEQVVQAAKDGANWCSPGWCEFTDINGQKVLRAAYPLTSQLTDPKCITQDDSIALYDKGIVVVSTPTTLKANIMVYKKKEENPVNLTSQNNQIFKQAYFNAMTGRWKRSSTLDIAKNEIFAVTKKDGGLSSNEIAGLASNLQCAIVTEQQIERQLEFIKGKGIPLPNITVVGWALDNSNMPIKIKLDGQFTKLPATTSFVNSLYCYGIKETANGKLDTNIYTMQAYNAQLNIANQNDNINYKPMIFKTKALIDKAAQNNIKGALILKEVRETPQGIVREGFSSLSYKNIYVGCDKDSYGCITLSGSGEPPAPPPLVSKNGKFQIKEMQTSNGSAFDKPTSIAQGIQNARDCQEAGGDIAITDETYPGCPAGQCCEPVEPADNTVLDTSMFADTCDDSNTASAVEQCDDTEEVLPLHQQAFEPYKLTRIQRTKTPTTAKCTKPKLSKSLKETFQNTPEYMRDIHQITKNERIFSLRMM